ncbi:MAG: hypothetical protein LQ350_000010 [Teloschistes chrysophthalmus]|nr:MAG: hypothetical protein LQ350_000010 [Niorma chrysophthalma]
MGKGVENTLSVAARVGNQHESVLHFLAEANADPRVPMRRAQVESEIIGFTGVRRNVYAESEVVIRFTCDEGRRSSSGNLWKCEKETWAAVLVCA